MLPNPQSIVDRLRELQSRILDTLLASRQQSDLHAVHRTSTADTIYRIDMLIEPVIEAFCRDWAKTTPLVLIAEGFEDENGHEGAVVFPTGTREQDALIRVIIDPIDGTRELMYDKRSAWALAGVAPNKGPATCLRDIEVSVMTELPTSKAACADILWAIKGHGAQGVRMDLQTRVTRPLPIQPSIADTLAHGWASIVNYFPGTKVLASQAMEHIIHHHIGPADPTNASVFDDQYLCTGGQFYEMIVGHDRFLADLRPIFYRFQNQPVGLCCHPYDCAAALIAEEAGVILTNVFGLPIDGPLDTTTPIPWAAYANKTIQAKIEPLLLQFLNDNRIK